MIGEDENPFWHWGELSFIFHNSMSLEEMTPEERANMKRWVDTWKVAGPELERMREEELHSDSTIRAFEIFEGMAFLATRDYPPEPVLVQRE
jgi:hypothetical protein